MKWTRAIAVCLGLSAACASAQPGVIGQASDLELRGRFKEAANLLTKALADPALPAAQRRQLEFERDRLERIRKDFPLTREELFAELKKAVRDFTAEEFERWIAEGRFDSRDFDGERRYMGSSVSNLFFRHSELEARRILPKDATDFEKRHLQVCEAIQQAARAEQRPYVLPRRFRHTMTVTVQAGVAPGGEVICAWLPVPRSYPFQADFQLLKTSSPVKYLAPDTSPIRSVLLEQSAQAGLPTEFRVEYEYTAYGVWFDVVPGEVRAVDPGDPVLKPWLAEAPHVVFTPEMRALSRQVAGGEHNPYRLARRFYDWIAEHIRYSFAIEYSTIRNIGGYCRERGYGDCGQEALLFITLCRLNDIPARWQSGWNTFPGGKTIHDWAEVYFDPYGWIPVDPYMGIWATRYARALTEAEKHLVRDFYFGGLDQHRMAANSDHCQELVPPKKSLRSDTVDFQRGELERGARNIYFDQYSYRLEVEEVKTQPHFP